MNILVTGNKGMLGSALADVLKQAGHVVIGFDLPEHNLLDLEQLQQIALDNNVEFCFNCAAYTDVDGCETNWDIAYGANALAVKNLATVAQGCKFPLLHISTDYVFSGEGRTPYAVDEPLAPVSAYGKTKAAGEQFIIESGLSSFFIIRTAWLYGHRGKNFVETILNFAKQKDMLKVVEDQKGAPTYVDDLVVALVKFLNSAEYGIYHFTNSGETTWYGFAKEFLTATGYTGQLIPCSSAEYPRAATRPAYSVLSLQKTEAFLGYKIPTWQDGLVRYLKNRED